MSSRFQEAYSSLFSQERGFPDLKHDLKFIPTDSRMSVAQYIEESTGMSKGELLAKLISTTLGVSLTFVITYFGVKWLSNALDPTSHEKKQAQERAKSLMKRIGVNESKVKLTDYELCIAANLIDTTTIDVSWAHVGGLDEIVQDIKETVILPFKRKDLFSESSLIQAPKGVLLYGPPGCGKTLLAKAIAKAAGARFINLQISSLLDKWYGESQKRAAAVFSLAVKLQPTVIFIDEIDSFLRSRSSTDHEATVMMKTQFMSFWDGLVTDHTCQIMIVGATNRPQDVDSAILRRMPCMFHVDLPNAKQRYDILRIILEKEKLDEALNLWDVANKSPGLSGSDLKELCRVAAMCRIRDYLQEEAASEEFVDAYEEQPAVLRAITNRDFIRAIDKSMKTKRMTNFAELQQIPID